MPFYQESVGLHMKVKSKLNPRKRLVRQHPRVTEVHSDIKPSQATDVFWMSARRKRGTYPNSTVKSGKWLVFVPTISIDTAWAKIKKATEEGRLGSASKVSTARPNPNANDPSQHVVCVYTYDWTDESDVRRIREELRKLGFTNKLPYKSDEDTMEGKYRVTGHRKISKYYE